MSNKDYRAYANSFYKSRAWKKCRASYLAKVGGLCERCLQRGLIVPADAVHHKIYLTPDNIIDPAVALNEDNLEALCRDCHASEHSHARRFWVDQQTGKIFAKE